MLTIDTTDRADVARFRDLLRDLLDATEIFNPGRTRNERHLAELQWNMLSARFTATFGPRAGFPRNR